MRAENLQEVIRAQPFRPFALCLADGTRVNVPHPEWIAYSGGLTALVIEQDDRTHFIDVTLVTRLDVNPPVPAGTIAENPNGGE